MQHPTHRSFLCICFLLFVTFAKAVEIPTKASNATGFVPAGWMLLASAKGDLNKDGRADVALVIESKKNRSYIENGETHLFKPRMLVVAFGDKL